MIPISIGSFIGPIIFAKYFDTYSRRKMIISTYFMTGIIKITVLAMNGLLELFKSRKNISSFK